MKSITYLLTAEEEIDQLSFTPILVSKDVDKLVVKAMVLNEGYSSKKNIYLENTEGTETKILKYNDEAPWMGCLVIRPITEI